MAGVFDLGNEADVGGEFKRQDSGFRDRITADGSSGLPAATSRYHLYVALACPWSHRTVIVRELKGLHDVVSMSLIDPFRDARGWAFHDGEFSDPLHGWDFLSRAYEATDPDYDARVSVPVLWDRETERIVSNASEDIMRMLNSEFDEFAGHPELDLYPAELRDEIDPINERVYSEVNNGVYCTGFAESQDAYNVAFERLFDALSWLEELLGSRRYLAGDRITEADWRLFPTLVRFDAVYYVHFRANGRRLIDHPNLWAYARELRQHPGIEATIAMDQIKRHYYTTHDDLNPKRIIPGGPLDVDWTEPHKREKG